MLPLIIASMAVQIAGTAYQISSSLKTAKENKKLLESQSATQRAQASENYRRAQIDNILALGTEKTRIGASGFENNGSMMDNLFEDTRNLELNALNDKWLTEQGADRLQQQGKQAAREGKNYAIGAGISGVAGILNTASQYTLANTSRVAPSTSTQG